MKKVVFRKICPSCGEVQTYTTKYTLERAVKENCLCNNCSSVHSKKIYDNTIIDEITKKYLNGDSFSKIASLMKLSRDNIKSILIDKNVWVENRDEIKKTFNDNEINNIIYKYVNENLSCDMIAKHYNVSKRPINRILKEKGLLRKGLSSGIKIMLTDEQKDKIKKLYLEEYKNSKEIADEIEMNENFINKYLQNSGFRRNLSNGVSIGLVKRWGNRGYNDYLNSLSGFKDYKRKVINITNRQPIDTLLNYDKRGVSGVEGNYHLDHKYSILEGYKNNISPEVIGNIKNLKFIPWEENIKKRTKNSITINELIN